MSKQMMITLTGESLDEIREKVKNLAKELGIGVENVELAEKPVAKKSPAKKQPDHSEPVPNGHDKKEKPAVVATKNDAMDALQELNAKKGIPAARIVLSKFEANRFSEIKEKDYGAFVDACKTEMT